MTKSNELLALDLQFLAEDGKQDGGESTGQDAPKIVTMTQEEFDAVIVREKGRVKSKYADYDEIKAKADEFEAEKARIERESMDETERIKADLAAEQLAKQELADQLTALQQQAEKQRIHAAFIRKASDVGIKYTDAAAKLSDLSALEFDEGGELIGIDDVLNALITENPFLIEVAPVQPKQIGGPSNAGGEQVEKTKEQLLEEAKQKAFKSGLPKDRAAYAKLKRELG